MNFENKYLEYKKKYLQLKKIGGGNFSENLEPGLEVFSITDDKSWSKLKERLGDNSGWRLTSGSKVLDSTYKKKWKAYDNNIYIGNELYKNDLVIAVSDSVKKQLEKEGDMRDKKIYKPEFWSSEFLDDLSYESNGKFYITQTFKLEPNNNKLNVLVGWENYKTDEDQEVNNIELSKKLSTGIEIFGKTNDKSWGKLESRLQDNSGWKLSTGSKVLDKTFNEKWTDIDPMFLFNDNSQLYIGLENDYEEFTEDKIIAISDEVKKKLREEDDDRCDKIYKVYLFGNYIDDMIYEESNKWYVTRSFQPERINDKTILLGWKLYSTYLIDKSKKISTGTEIYGKDGKSWGILESRLDDDNGWKLSTGNKVLDSTFNKKWDITVSENIKKSRAISKGTEIYGLDGKSWGILEYRLDNNIGWKLSTGSKALDASYGKKWNNTLSKNIKDSRKLKINTEIFNKSGMAISKLVGRFPNNLGWILSSGKKALDMNYDKKWDTNMPYNTRESRKLIVGARVFSKNGKDLSELLHRLDNGLGWILASGETVYDSNFNKKWKV